jgi:hypothetical protein
MMLLPVSYDILFLFPLGCIAATSFGKSKPVNQTTCNGNTYIYQELAGWGLLPSNARDKYGDTIGGIGSAIALEKKSWKRTRGGNEAYEGVIYGLPDRGWNTQGTIIRRYETLYSD